MAFKQTLQRWYQTIVVTAVVMAGGLLLLPAHVLATPYGSGDYGDCPYSQGCASSSSTPASGTTPSTGSTTPNQSKIVLNDFKEFFTDSGKTLDLTASQVVYFNITVNGQIESHTITVKQIGDTFVVLTFAPNSFDVTLTMGQTGQYDVNNDGTNDIRITLNSIKDGKANLTFAATPGSSASQPSTTTSNNTAASSTSPKKGHAWLGLILSVFAILLALFIFFFLWWRRRKKREEQANWPTNPPVQPGAPSVQGPTPSTG